MSLLTKAVTGALGLNPWVVLGIAIAIFAAGGAAVGVPLHMWMDNKVTAAKALQSAAETKLTAKEGELSMADADVKRWRKDATDLRAQVTLANAEVEKAKADFAKAQSEHLKAEAANAANIAGLERDLQKWKERHRANPDQANRNGPIATSAWCSFLRTADGGLPAGCPAAPGN